MSRDQGQSVWANSHREWPSLSEMQKALEESPPKDGETTERENVSRLGEHVNALLPSVLEGNDYSRFLEFVLRSKRNNVMETHRFLQKSLDLLNQRMVEMKELSPSPPAFHLANSDSSANAPEYANGPNHTAPAPATSSAPLPVPVMKGPPSIHQEYTDSPRASHAGSEVDPEGDLRLGNIPFSDYIGDYTDLKPYTLIILVNGSLGVIGHLIGKGGAAISKMEKEANVRIRVEDTKSSPVGLVERRVHITGALSNCTYAQQLITERVHAKLKQDGILQELIKIFIPQEYISHVIGKGGSNIKRIEKESNTRIHIWHEGTAVTDYAVGKIMVIQGSRYNRSKAQYLIARQISSLPSPTRTDERNGAMPEEPWATANQSHPTSPTAGGWPMESGPLNGIQSVNSMPAGSSQYMHMPVGIGMGLGTDSMSSPFSSSHGTNLMPSSLHVDASGGYDAVMRSSHLQQPQQNDFALSSMSDVLRGGSGGPSQAGPPSRPHSNSGMDAYGGFQTSDYHHTDQHTDSILLQQYHLPRALGE